MRTKTCGEEAAPWSRRNHLTGTRWLPQVTTAIPLPEPLTEPELGPHCDQDRVILQPPFPAQFSLCGNLKLASAPRRWLEGWLCLSLWPPVPPVFACHRDSSLFGILGQVATPNRWSPWSCTSGLGNRMTQPWKSPCVPFCSLLSSKSLKSPSDFKGRKRKPSALCEEEQGWRQYGFALHGKYCLSNNIFFKESTRD
jgi:hypothetical protein